MWKPLPSRRVRKTLRESPKRIIPTSGGLRLLQMVSEPDTGRCASKDAGPQGGWMVSSHQLKGGTKHSLQGCGNLSLADGFKNLEGKPNRENRKKTISARRVGGGY